MNPVLSALTAVPLAGWGAHATALHHSLTKARRDPLTALPTRDRFTARAAKILRGPALVVLVDLDRFKPLNDTHGHAAGDAALRAIAERLAGWATQRGGIAARIGGDEFAAAIPTRTDPGAHLAALHRALNQPAAHRELVLDVGASVGGCATTTGAALSEALHAADTAMYAVKANGGGWHLTGPGPDPAAPGRWKRTRHTAPAAPLA